jgi:hypothetical protein
MKSLYKIERLYLAALMIFFVTFGAADCVGQDNHKLAVLKKCERLFGAPIDAKVNLFQIDSQFILQPEFSADDNLFALHVNQYENVHVENGQVGSVRLGPIKYRFFDFYLIHEIGDEIIKKSKIDDSINGVGYKRN